MTGCAHLLDFNQETILIAVYIDTSYALDVTGGFPLHPIFLTRTTPESNAFRGDGTLDCLLVHVSHHQHVPVLSILHHGGDQTLVIKLKTVWNLQATSPFLPQT